VRRAGDPRHGVTDRAPAMLPFAATLPEAESRPGCDWTGVAAARAAVPFVM
jgi:hypothetical protein